jgi:hypothetical protein
VDEYDLKFSYYLLPSGEMRVRITDEVTQRPFNHRVRYITMELDEYGIVIGHEVTLDDGSKWDGSIV